MFSKQVKQHGQINDPIMDITQPVLLMKTVKHLGLLIRYMSALLAFDIYWIENIPCSLSCVHT